MIEIVKHIVFKGIVVWHDRVNVANCKHYKVIVSFLWKIPCSCFLAAVLKYKGLDWKASIFNNLLNYSLLTRNWRDQFLAISCSNFYSIFPSLSCNLPGFWLPSCIRKCLTWNMNVIWKTRSSTIWQSTLRRRVKLYKQGIQKWLQSLRSSTDFTLNWKCKRK